MSENEKAEAFLIVVKRLLKWAGFAALLIAALVAALLGYEEYVRYVRDKPRLLTEYAEVKLGDSADQVRYALGYPPEFLVKLDEKATGNVFDQFPLVLRSNDPDSAHRIAESKAWQYPGGTNTQLTVEFDKPEGVVVSVSCYSETVYSCPEVFGLQDGSSEEEVLEHLGNPDSEAIETSAKVLRYTEYNLTLYLMKKRVYSIEVTAPPVAL